MRAAIAASTMAAVMAGAAAQTGSLASKRTVGQAVQPMIPNGWVSFAAPPPKLVQETMTAPLNLTPEPDGVEEITVLGKRRQPIQERDRAASLSLGPFMLEGSTGQVGGFEGARVSASTPLGGVRGLDAVMSVSGGYEQRSQNATVSGGAVTAGIRLRF